MTTHMKRDSNGLFSFQGITYDNLGYSEQLKLLKEMTKEVHLLQNDAENKAKEAVKKFIPYTDQLQPTFSPTLSDRVQCLEDFLRETRKEIRELKNKPAWESLFNQLEVRMSNIERDGMPYSTVIEKLQQRLLHSEKTNSAHLHNLEKMLQRVLVLEDSLSKTRQVVRDVEDETDRVKEAIEFIFNLREGIKANVVFQNAGDETNLINDLDYLIAKLEGSK